MEMLERIESMLKANDRVALLERLSSGGYYDVRLGYLYNDISEVKDASVILMDSGC